MPRPARWTNGNQKPEAEIRRACKRWLETVYGHHIFWISIAGGPYQRPGSPDVICCIRGIFVAIEFKAPNGRVGPKQAACLEEIRVRGGRAGIVSSIEELQALVEGIEPVQTYRMMK